MIRPVRTAHRPVGEHRRLHLIEYAIVLLSLGLVSVAVLQVAVWIYIRGVLVAVATDAVEKSGSADVSSIDVTEVARRGLGHGFASGPSESLRCSRITTARRVEVTCTMKSPGIPGSLDGVLPDITAIAFTVKPTATR